MLHVHRAERTDRLVAALADVLADPLEGPLTTEIVSVHSRGIERWIAQEVSSVLGTGDLGGDGVCANVDFPFPSRLVHAAVAVGSGVEPDQDPWLPERLVWPLLEVVDEHRGEAMLGPLRTHLGGSRADPDPERADRRFGAVRHIADLFDRYGVHRPRMVRRWRAGEDVGPDGGGLAARHRWQPQLWRAVRDRVEVPSFAERLAAATERLRTDPGCLQLPERVALFGLTALPASYLTVLEAIAAHREVHLLLLHPSPSLWERIAETAGEGRRRLWTREEDPTADEPRNPLLASWGRDARELQLITPAGGAEHHHHAGGAAPRRDTLLGRIQADVRADRPPGRGGDEPRLLDATDTSLQVHSCHGRLRQVEVLRDTLLHLLAADEDLEPRDIIVMCPDIEAFAPLVTAVFGARTGAEDGALPELRVRLADRSLRRTNPVLEVVSLLLELVDGRMTSAQVLDLASREPVRRRFDLDDEQLETLESWIGELGIRWGLDGAHRRRQGLPELEANTWSAGLRRLQLGIAMADEDLRMVGEVVPFDDVEGQDSDLAGRLSELVARLRTAAEAMDREQSVRAWRDAIGAAADDLTATSADTDWQRLQLRRVLEELVEESERDGGTSPVELTLGEVRRLLEDRLQGRPSRTSHRTGDLTVCTLVPMRSVPHRVVCLLGLDDDVFPRRTVPDSDDLLRQAPRIGDRDPRSEDRQLLLDALLAATETLVVTYTGRDERTNQPRPPAVPVGELLDVVDRTARTGNGRPARRAVTTAHPLQAFDPRSFTPGGLRPDDKPFSFDRDGLAAARAAVGRADPPPAFLGRRLALPEEDTIDLEDLVAFLEHPVRAFVRQRLEISLPPEEERLREAIPATLRGLDGWRVGEQLLAAWQREQDPDRALQLARARGLVPPGDLGEDDVAQVRERVERIRGLCERLGVAPDRRRTVDIEVELPDGRTLVGSVPDVAGWQLQAISYSRLKAKHRLASWARLLAVTADEPVRPWEAATVARHTWKGGAKARAALLSPLAGTAGARRREAALARLECLVDLYDRGRRSPLPLYCNSSLKSAIQYRRGEDPRRYVHYEWESDDYVPWDKEDRDPYHLLVLGGQVPTDELFEEACRDEDEASWAEGSSRFVAYAWRLWEPILDHERMRES